MAASRQNDDANDNKCSMHDRERINVDDNDDKNANENINRNDVTHEYLPNVVQLEPDIGLGNHSVGTGKRFRNETDHLPMKRKNGDVGAVYFLRNDSGSSSSDLAARYPDLYQCLHQEISSPCDDTKLELDNPDLPDFVQDHLVVEHTHIYSDDEDARSSTSYSRNLPDFASCTYRNGCVARGHRRSDTERPEELFNSSLPFDLTTNAVRIAYDERNSRTIEVAVCASSSSNAQLPDFLSDGCVFSHDTINDTVNISQENAVSRGLEKHIDRHDTISMLKQENNSLRNQISSFQSELTKKKDRIKELEDIVMALEISNLQISRDANTQTTSKNASDNEIVKLRRELELAKKEMIKLQRERIDSLAEQCRKMQPFSYLDEKHASLVMKVQQMTQVSEKLISELSKIIAEIRVDFDV